VTHGNPSGQSGEVSFGDLDAGESADPGGRVHARRTSRPGPRFSFFRVFRSSPRAQRSNTRRSVKVAEPTRVVSFFIRVIRGFPGAQRRQADRSVGHRNSSLTTSRLVVLLSLTILQASPILAAESDSHEHRSLADVRIGWPTREKLVRVVTLQDYNTRVVAMGTLLLGIAAAMVGVFMLLRRRSLIGDVIGHASLPGIATAFLVLEIVAPGSGKSLPALLCGAIVSGLLGVACTTFIVRFSRIKEDAALAIVLSVFFGLGIALLTVIQRMPTGNAAGLQEFIFGKAASMVSRDIQLIGGAAVAIVILFGFLFKEFALLSFDDRFAGSQGWPVLVLDLTLMSLVTGVTVIALQSVGMLLAVAMLVIPAAASRFWTDRLVHMTWLAAAIGGLAALMGVFASALFPRLAAGAVIVLCGSFLFTLSMFLGKQRGILIRLRRHWRVQKNVGRDHLLRAFFEHLESQNNVQVDLEHSLTDHSLTQHQLLEVRSWKTPELRRWLASARRAGLVVATGPGVYRLTPQGAVAATSVVRNHRLWELYLIEYADIAPSHVDRDADDIEHQLGPAVITELEQLLEERYPRVTLPHSPHAIVPVTGSQ
jgi:manganese/zinc/iron transport system permease protein